MSSVPAAVESFFTNGVLVDLTATAVAFVLGLAARRILTYFIRRRPAGRLWGVTRQKRVEIIMTTAPEQSAGEHTTLVYPADAIAATEIDSYLTHLIKADCRLRLSDALPSTAWDHNLIVIGGPIHNRVTRQLLVDTAATVTFEENTIVLANGHRFVAETTTDSTGTTITRDFGLVLRARNPYRHSETTTLLIGSRTYGCLIAARALLHENTRASSKMVQSYESFGLIASAQILDGQVQEITLLESW